jgi:hypothetical protein
VLSGFESCCYNTCDVVALTEAEERIDLWKFIKQFCTHSLYETAGNDNFFYCASLFPIDGIFDELVCFEFGRFDEAAGVYDYGVGLFGFVDDEKTCLRDFGEHTLGIDSILGQPRLMKPTVN